MEKQPFQLAAEQHGNVAVIRVEGYFGEKAGKQLLWEASRFFQADLTRFVLDFSTCDYINSIGLANLMDVTLKIVDDRQGRVFLAGVNQLMIDVINISGIDEFAEYAPDAPTALRLLASTS
jgi:anti-anti-sigma factor